MRNIAHGCLNCGAVIHGSLADSMRRGNCCAAMPPEFVGLKDEGHVAAFRRERAAGRDGFRVVGMRG